MYDMQFIIKIKEPAEKWLRKYDREIQKRFATKIRKLQEHPDLHGKPLRGVLHGYWELYFENKFRILYTIDYKEKTVTIEAIKHKDDF
jgi:mRNA-degrading endonuclease RelE of RelBE toxin-antitoxin system